MSRILTAPTYVKKQAAFAEHLLNRIRAQIDAAEARGDDATLDDLFDEEFFWLRYRDYMHGQVKHFKDKKEGI